MSNSHTVIAKGKTSDRIDIAVWSDGLVTGRLGERTCMVRLPAELIAAAVETFARHTWAQLPGLIKSIKKAGRLPPTPEEASAIAQVNASDRFAAARLAVEHDRTTTGNGLRRLGY